jgi:hypothetical protein
MKVQLVWAALLQFFSFAKDAGDPGEAVKADIAKSSP